MKCQYTIHRFPSRRSRVALRTLAYDICTVDIYARHITDLDGTNHSYTDKIYFVSVMGLW